MAHKCCVNIDFLLLSSLSLYKYRLCSSLFSRRFTRKSIQRRVWFFSPFAMHASRMVGRRCWLVTQWNAYISQVGKYLQTQFITVIIIIQQKPATTQAQTHIYMCEIYEITIGRPLLCLNVWFPYGCRSLIKALLD